MALKALNTQHEKQIKAGVEGRKRGHAFEKQIKQEIDLLKNRVYKPQSKLQNEHIFSGNPASLLLQYIANSLNTQITMQKAWWLGALATSTGSAEGDLLYDQEKNIVTKCKSDIVLQIKQDKKDMSHIGISVKTCSKKTPTNDQMFFTTASAFCQLLRNAQIPVTNSAKEALSMFCGDSGFTPSDLMPASKLKQRLSDPARYYWEELPQKAQDEWQNIFLKHQDLITSLLFQKAYKNDPFPPDFLLHQTSKYSKFEECPIAIFTIPEIVKYSRLHSPFLLSKYTIKKGRFKNDETVHYAPRFGFIQFQRGGQKQHPTQLQFNLKAGYFKHLSKNCL